MAQIRLKDKRVMNAPNRFPTAKSKRSIRTSGCWSSFPVWAGPPSENGKSSSSRLEQRRGIPGVAPDLRQKRIHRIFWPIVRRHRGDLLPRTYTLKRLSSLLLTRAAVTGPGGTKAINLLIDTGSSFTILPLEVLESIGLRPAKSQQHQKILTLTGYIIAPKVQILSLHTCGKHLESR